MTESGRNVLVRMVTPALVALALSGCATAYSDRDGESPLKGIAAMGGLATTVPEAKDFVKDSRSESLDYIPIGVSPDASEGKRKPMTPDELLILQKKLAAEQKQNSANSPSE